MSKKIKIFIFSAFLLPVVNVSAISKVSCGNVTGIPEKIPALTSDVITIIEVAVPVILVIMGVLDFFKAVRSDDDKEMKKAQNLFIKRVITAVIIFFIIAGVKFLVSVITDSTSANNIVECIDCFLSGVEKCNK